MLRKQKQQTKINRTKTAVVSTCERPGAVDEEMRMYRALTLISYIRFHPLLRISWWLRWCLPPPRIDSMITSQMWSSDPRLWIMPRAQADRDYEIGSSDWSSTALSLHILARMKLTIEKALRPLTVCFKVKLQKFRIRRWHFSLRLWTEVWTVGSMCFSLA